jgi:PAS domain S-box-containing protein
MVDEKSIFHTHKKALIDTAFETLLTSHWVVDLDLSEQTCRKIFSDIFTQIENDLFSESDQPGYYLSRYYLTAFQTKSELTQNFYAQLAFLGISRIIINHFLIHTVGEFSGEFQSTLEKIQKIFDYTLISLSQWWGQLYQDLRDKDLQLIRELNLVKDDLQKQLDVIYQIIRESPVGAANCDEYLNVLFWNPTAVRLTGYNPDEILKKNIITIFTDSSRDQLLSKIRPDRKRISNLRLYIQPKVGNSFPVLVSVSRLRYSRPGSIHFVINFQEISNNAVIEKSKQRLNQLTTITRLTSAIMHDIRNPLNSIGLNVEILETLLPPDNQENSNRVQELLKKIEFEIQQLSKNLNHYLAYGHLTELYLEPFNLADRFKSFLDDISLEATMKKIKIHFKSDHAETWISGDWLQLNRVFMNIMQNALEVTSESGDIYVGLYCRNNRVIISIRDSGPGIPVSQRRKIFEPFFTTKKSGTGLGLFISKEIVKAHGGRITYQPSKSGGTIFTVSIPAIEVMREKKNE